MSHTTGWPNWRPDGQPLRRESPLGERFTYSGEGYVYLQHVAEHRTGAPLDALVGAHVFVPLHMAQSSFEWRPADDPSSAAGHGSDGAPISPHIGERPNAASSLHTTPGDYAHFMSAILNPDGASWSIGRATVDEMLRSQVTNGEGGRALCARVVEQVLGADHPALAWLASRYKDPSVDATPC